MWRALLRRRRVGWCPTCKRTVYDHEPSYLLDGTDLRVHEACRHRLQGDDEHRRPVRRSRAK